MTQVEGSNGVFLFLSVGLPFLIVVVMNSLEALSEVHRNWRHRLLDVGWDTCVLAMGIIGGVFANPSAKSTLGDWAMGLAILAFVLSLGSAVGIAFLKKDQQASGWKAFLALALGGAALALPTYVAAGF